MYICIKRNVENRVNILIDLNIPLNIIEEQYQLFWSKEPEKFKSKSIQLLGISIEFEVRIDEHAW